MTHTPGPEENSVDDDPTTEWGYWLGDKSPVWIRLPKLPMLHAGHRNPPFNVTRPDGRIIRVEARKVID